MSYMAEPVFTTPAAAPAPGEPAPAGSPGTYHLTYVLAIPGQTVVQDKVDFAKLVQAGDSLLEVPAHVRHLRIELHDGAGHEQSATVNVNAGHRLRDVELEIHADSRAHAAQIGHDLIPPLLSRWAYLHDVAITTSAVQIVETATRIQQWSLLIVGAVKTFSDNAGVSDPDHRLLLSAYRDGISSTEPLWQAMSLFRVAEGVLQMRKTRTAASGASGQTPAKHAERVPASLTAIGQPNDFGLIDSLRPYAGRKFTAALDDIRPALRNAIAHLDPDSTMLVQDRWDDLQKVEQALPGLRWIARQLLDSELQHDDTANNNDDGPLDTTEVST
jgi:hypothetical protein